MRVKRLGGYTYSELRSQFRKEGKGHQSLCVHGCSPSYNSSYVLLSNLYMSSCFGASSIFFLEEVVDLHDGRG